MSIKVWYFLPDFVLELQHQLESDDEQWGDTWLQRTREGQEQRTQDTFDRYFREFFTEGVPVPWLKIAGGAMICWIREHYPELWDK